MFFQNKYRNQSSPTRCVQKFSQACCIFLTLSACQQSNEEKDNDALQLTSEKAIFHFAIYDDITDWDPASAFSTEAVMLVNAYETLLWYDASGDEPAFIPALATSWSSNKEGTEWTFNIRQGVSFHDGEKLNARAVKRAIERTISINKGAAFIWSSLDRIEIVGPYTVRFICKDPAPIDLIASSLYGAYIYSPRAADLGEKWFNQGNELGTGPYRVVERVRGDYLKMAQFDKYWGGWKPQQFREVHMHIEPDNDKQLEMILSGNADAVNQIPLGAVHSLGSELDVSVAIGTSWVNTQFLINTKKYPTNNVLFRRALTYAWDYDAVVEHIYSGWASVPRGIIPSTLWGHDKDLPKQQFDLEKAKALLLASGIPKEDWKISLTHVAASEGYRRAARLYQYTLEQIGVKLEIKTGPWAEIWSAAKNIETASNLQSMTWWPTYPTPSDYLKGLFYTEEKTLFNLSHYSNPTFDRLVDEGIRMEGVDRKQSVKYYQQAQQILYDDAVAIFYADNADRRIFRSDIEGMVLNPAYNPIFIYQLSRTAP